MHLTGDLLAHPFTPAIAARAGTGRAELDRLVREGDVVRLLRGVYLGSGVTLTTPVRARAVGLRVGGRRVVARRTAAWVHGAGRVGGTPTVPVDSYGPRSRSRAGPPLGPGDVVVVAGLRCTSPVRTALDLARTLAPERALPLVDGLLRAGVLVHADVLAACPDLGRGTDGAREVLARADGRARDEAESVLRLRWLEATLPTPTPGLVAGGARFALGLRAQRFGVVLAGTVSTLEVERCRSEGWRVIVLPGRLVVAADPVLVTEQLESAFHQHLLGQLARGG
ncbi:MAG: type IV toxin-antitoxin system AbiEi family antitoxin domain-containing protein [Marmoricola sp.]